MNVREMLEAQYQLQVESFGFDPLAMGDEERLEYIRWNTLAHANEMHEMLQETSWKVWQTARFVNVTNAIGELVDAWFFHMNLLLAIGGADPVLTVEEIAQLFTEGYERKLAVNTARMAGEYDGVVGKCDDCHRDLATVTLIDIVEADGSSRQACPCGKVL